MIIFLTDLQNSYYRYIRNSVPIGMGFVAAYLEKVFGDALEIHQFRKFEELHEALKEKTPHLVAMGSYSWNTSLTNKTARYLRERFPRVIIAVGGPDVSEIESLTVEDLRANPAVDFRIANEGEGPLRHLIEAALGTSAGDLRRIAVPGCLSLDTDTGEVRGHAISRFEGDINEIPSPYLTGLMDQFLSEPDYLPIIQTARGCPYQCTFCVSGKDSWSKIKPFEVERVKAEIDYIAERAVNRYMRLADENFGILPRDVEIAEYLMHKRQDTGFPASVSVYTDKHPNERVKAVNLLLRDLMPFNISYQSTSEHVLANIKRVNLKDARVDRAVDFALANDLMLVSELIFALPGETADSFVDSIDCLLDYRFESIAINQLRILKGTEMDLPEDRRKYGVKTMFAMSENGYTNHPELENIEIDEWVVENDTLTRQEYYETSKFIFVFDFGHFRGLLREILFFFETLGVRGTSVLRLMVGEPAQYPVAGGYADRFVTEMRKMLFNSADEAMQFVREKMASNPSELEGIYRIEDRLMIELLMTGSLAKVVKEAATAGRRLYERRHGPFSPELEDQLEFVQKVVTLCHIPLDKPSPVELAVEGRYDVTAWVKERYSHPLDAYRKPEPTRTGLRIHVPEVYETLWSNDDTPFERYKRHFLTINSSNRRRMVVQASSEAVPVPTAQPVIP